MEDIKHLMIMSMYSSQTYWCLRTDNVNLTPCYLTISQSEYCARADHTPWDTPLSSDL